MFGAGEGLKGLKGLKGPKGLKRLKGLETKGTKGTKEKSLSTDVRDHLFGLYCLFGL